MKKISKLIVVNLFITMGLLIALNLTVILVYQVYQAVKGTSKSKPSYSQRHLLPNYSNHAWAEKHFVEFESLQSEYRSYIGWRRLPFSGETILVDDEGIRYTPQSELVSDQSKVVAFLGGSTMWGTGADHGTTIPAYFSLIGQGQYKTVNLAESAYRAFQEFVWLQLQIDCGFSPDIIVSYNGVNERNGFLKELSPSAHVRELQIRIQMQGKDNAQIEEALSLRHFFFAPIMTFMSGLRQRMTEPKVEYDLSEARTDQVARSLLNSWMSAKYLADRVGAEYYCVLQPYAGSGQSSLDHLDINPEFMVPFGLLYPEVHRLIHTAQYEALQPHFIDLSDVFNHPDTVYIDFCHLSPNGNERVARELMSRFADNRAENQ